MSKAIGLACSAIFLFLLMKPHNDRFLKYKTVETYEVRPGILMMPSYASDGKICKIEVEKRHYSNETAFLDSKLKHELMIEIIDELVPYGERGQSTSPLASEYLSVSGGNTVTTFAEYENVTINVFSEAASQGDVVAIISWKNRHCQ